jgi:heme/copper-type cytochrome/quinol oxidase subunit 2
MSRIQTRGVEGKRTTRQVTSTSNARIGWRKSAAHIGGTILRNRLFVFPVILACLLTGSPVRAQSADGKNDAPARVIEISAKKNEFSPTEIRVKMGERIQLKVHSVDETHGVKIDVYPEGSKDKSTPGLKFAQPEQNGKVEKNVDQVLEFVAVKEGAYEFKCAKLCGMGHGRMKGKLIVE